LSSQDEFAEALRARAQSAQGKHSIRAGDVYVVDDRALNLPSALTRTMHESRHVIVVQSERFTNLPQQKTVMVVPCSKSYGIGPFDCEFEDENGFAPGVVKVFVSLIQPLLKTDLGKRKGSITTQSLLGLRSQLLLGLGIPIRE